MTERPDSNSGTEAEDEAAPQAETTPPTGPRHDDGHPDADAARSGVTAVSSSDAAGAHGAGDDEDDASAKKKQRPLSHELPVLLVIAIGLALLLKAFVVQAFYIPSGSMEQTLLIKDRVLVNKVIYRFRDVHRGEIVVFNGGGTGFTRSESVIPPPRNDFERATRWVQRAIGAGAPGERDFVKRVIAVGGDTVACCDAKGRVTVNGVPLDEPYIYDNSPDVDGARKFPATKVPEGDLWVMGDHRGDSNDSRFSGMIPQNHVIGRAFVRVWPIKRFGFLRVPDTFSKTHSAAPAALGLVGIPALVLLRRRR